jgi:Zn-dependent protease with chaperone function
VIRTAQVLLGVFFTLASLSLRAEGSPQPPLTPDAAFTTFQDTATSNPFIVNWWMNQRTYLLRDRLDREVYAILQSDSASLKILDDARNQMVDDVEQERIKNLSGAAFAQKGETGQYEDLLDMTRKVATAEGFPKVAIDNTNLFVALSNEINAYTYSSLRDQALDLVLFTPIIDAMTKSQLEAVVGHELGHIMSEHVLISTTLNAIFEKTGRNLIPPEEKLTFDALLRSNLREAVRGLYSAMGTVDVPEKAVDWYINLARSIASRIPDDAATKKKLIHVTEQILDAAGASHDVTDNGMKRAMAAFRGDVEAAITLGNPKDAKEFQKALTRHTRSCESTADRHSMVYVGAEPLKESMAILTGGKGANPKAVWEQVRTQTLAMQKYGMDADDIDNGDHPLSPFRVGAVEGFQASYDYKIVKDPFLGLLDMTIKATRYAAYLQANVNTGSGTGWREQNSLRRDEYIKLAKLGAEMITQIIVDDIAQSANKDQKNPLPNFEKLIGYFNLDNHPPGSLTPVFASLPEQNIVYDMIELGKPGRLGDLLITRLGALSKDKQKGGAAYQAALNLLNTVMVTVDMNAAQQLQLRNIVHAARGEQPEQDPAGLLTAAGFASKAADPNCSSELQTKPNSPRKTK